jgi:hypothetical protein
VKLLLPMWDLPGMGADMAHPTSPISFHNVKGHFMCWSSGRWA